MPRRSPKRPLRPPRPHHTRKPLSISLTSDQRKLLTEVPRSFNNLLLNLLVNYLVPTILLYLHTVSLSLAGHLAVVAAMLFVLHLRISSDKLITQFAVIDRL